MHKFKTIFSKKTKNVIEYFGMCHDCKKPNTGIEWCNKCDPGRFLREGKTSGNPEIDKLIHESQLNTDDSYNLEWISYDKFLDIKPISEGGFSNIFSASWNNKRRNPNGSITVALKKFKNSINMTEAFINEIKMYNEFDNSLRLYIVQFYGITKDPQTEEFMMVLKFADENLREYLKKNFHNLNWKEKLNILCNIADSLDVIHKNNYIHKDLHSGNILQFYTDVKVTKISDLGIAKLIQNSRISDSSNVCGVLPYIAPEVLYGEPYTFSSDIYSFGIIMIEMTTGKPPYSNVPHDEKLALAICNGLRPRVAKGTPKVYINLVNQCLDANPEKRPKNISYYLQYLKSYKNFINSINSQDSISENKFHSEAIYISRYMSFTNLTIPRNSTKVQIEDLKVSDSQLIVQHISDDFQSSFDQDYIELNEDVDKIDLIQYYTEDG
ncbi:kinase-like domain-containing protein [Rhizophagus diaphanus]|nr:kinase-like domain-containing protein [Rhizophagus diaphanus] [Rhizophagus sp. MUCL 43196]